MSWFLCSGKLSRKAAKKKKLKNKKTEDQISSISEQLKANLGPSVKEAPKDGGSGHIAAHTFTFRELAAATKNFRADCILGEGGFGQVYKGRLESTNQVVAIKQLDSNGLQGNREFLVEARPLFRDRRKFWQIADPMLQGQYPVRGMYQALAVAAMCVQDHPNMRPVIADAVTALSYLASQKYDPEARQSHSSHTASSTPRSRRELLNS
ncbi:hypothetical protein C1H46_038906 [Malus baccata]|uniref:Protein kinase domain-containing protein n=1 Tax=Malus baccata TaxID=106549 RepID=A0A540KMX2_MALBA|nr:hypothetical protein C1H46_038906 [Malus baccata]